MLNTRYGLSKKLTQADIERCLDHMAVVYTKKHRKFSRDFLDTLDWRLLAKGYYLIAEQYVDECVVQLFKLTQSHLISQYHSDCLPSTMATLGQGKLAVILKPILKERALVSHVTLAVNQLQYGIEDENHKTTERVLLEAERVVLPKLQKPSPLTTLEFEVVKGYTPKLSVKKLQLDKQQLHKFSEESRLDFWITHLKLDTQRYETPQVTLTPKMRSDEAAKIILKSFLHDIQVNEQVVIDDVDVECLHEYRVAIRRTRSFLSQVPNIFPKRTLEKYKKGLAMIGGITTPQRDLDVMLLEFDHYLAFLPKHLHSSFEPVAVFIQQQRYQAYQNVTRYLRSAKYKDLITGWQAFLYKGVPERTSLANAVLPVEQVANQCIWKTYKKLLKKGKKINSRSEDEALHDLRKIGKKLRYLVEFFSSLHSKKEIKQVVKTLKLLQDNLGEFQDIHVHQTLLAEIRREMQQSKTLQADTEQAFELLQQALEVKHQQCRQRFYASFAGFSDESHQAIFIKLYKS